MPAQSQRTGVRFVAENDVGYSDKFYTNGVRLEYMTREAFALNPARWLAHILTGPTDLAAFGEDAGQVSYTSLALSGDAFTPRYITKADISFGDRPYASWTYLSSAYHVNDGREFLTAEIQAGGLGPGTGNREAQTFVHRNSSLSGSPNGWDHQIPYETGINLSALYERRLFATDLELDRLPGQGSTEFLVFARPRLGNIYTDAQAGFQINFGQLGPGDHQKLWRGDEHDGSQPYAYAYVRPSLRYVGYNATLEGPFTGGGRSTHIYREDEDAKYLAYSSLTRDREDLSETERRESFNTLVRKRNKLDYRENFINYLRTFYGGSTADVGEKILVYETLFRETLPYEKEDEVDILVLHSLMQSRTPVTAENLYFWSNTIFRADGESLRPLTRWIAFRKLNGDRSGPGEQAAQYVVLFNGSRLDHRNYGVPPRRLVVEGDIGVSLGQGPLRVILGWTAQSAEFDHQREIPDWHGWWHAEVAYLF